MKHIDKALANIYSMTDCRTKWSEGRQHTFLYTPFLHYLYTERAQMKHHVLYIVVWPIKNVKSLSLMCLYNFKYCHSNLVVVLIIILKSIHETNVEHYPILITQPLCPCDSILLLSLLIKIN